MAVSCENLAIAAFCEHDVMWGAHVVKSDEAREIIAASRFLDAGRRDYLMVVPSEQVRVSLSACRSCDFVETLPLGEVVL